MKKSLAFFACFYALFTLSAQDVHYTKTGTAHFFSSAPLEDIEAKTQKTISFLNVKTGEIQFKISMKSFQFDKSLMQEHFNENYVESEKFPHATMKGKITNISNFDGSKKSAQILNIEGNITIHGVTKKIKTKCTLTPQKGKILGHSKFKIKVADHKIEIPKMVFQNIAEEVEVTIDVEYLPYKK